MNQSKLGDSRFWRKWHASGAVTKEQFPENLPIILNNLVIARLVNGSQVMGYLYQMVNSKYARTGWDWNVTNYLLNRGRMEDSPGAAIAAAEEAYAEVFAPESIVHIEFNDADKTARFL